MKYLLLLMFGFLFPTIHAQSDQLKIAISCQQFLNEYYANMESSPLKVEDLKRFSSLEFFTISEEYIIEARLIRTPDEKPFEMPTTTSRKPLYVKYGELHFNLDGKDCKLNVYQNIDFSRRPDYANQLFLPFTDLTSGDTTYGGGRYLDVTIPEEDTLVLNFHCAYNPLCAYNEKYSCPIVPAENDLPVAVQAGVKAFKK
ncbi:MAG: DUF1684 domain-containing protein [Flavobacterium sp.]